MEDLNALTNHGRWTELLDRGDQVRPSDRTKVWQERVTQAGTNQIEAYGNLSSEVINGDAPVYKSVSAYEKKYPFLTQDKKYLQAKAKAAQGLTRTCVARPGANCWLTIEALTEGVSEYPAGAAKEIAQYMKNNFRPSESLKYWIAAVKENKEVCKESAFIQALANTLSQDPKSPAVGDAKTTLKACLPAIEPEMVDQLRSAKPGDNFTVNSCALLLDHGKVTLLKKSKCQ